MRILGLIVGLWLSTWTVLAQDVRFVASADAEQLVAGNYFQVTFTLENARGGAFAAPSFIDFQVLSGPNRSSQMSIVNGRVSQKLAYSYTLSSDRPGTYTIGPARIEAEGKTYETQPIRIIVLKGDPSSSKSSASMGDHFMRLEISDDVAHVGQQITLKYVLFTTADVRSYNFTKLPDFEGFFAQEIQNYSERPVQVVENGVQYVRRTIKVIALFPQQKGVFMIDPARVNIGVASRGSRSSFFFNTNLKPVGLTTESAQLTVTDLPADPPASFSGAVGRFQLATSIDKSNIQSDDAVTLTFQIRGDGDNKFVQAPEQSFTEAFEIYDPNLLQEQPTVRGARVEFTKTYEYLLVPKKTGVIRFTPEMTYFDVDSNAYVTLKGASYDVNVLESAERSVAEFETVEVALPPLITATRLKAKNKFFYGSRPYWVANGVLGLSFIGLLIVKRIRLMQEGIDASVKRFTKAQKIAVMKLSIAKKELDNQNTTAFYAQLRKGILQYLSDKTGKDSSQLSKDQVLDILSSYGLEELESQVMGLLIKGEQALYGAILPGEDEASYLLAVDLIQKMETAFKK